MANFFEGVGNLLKHPIDEAKWMLDSTKGVLSGDKKLKDIPGDHQEMMNKITVPMLGDNKLSKNSDAVAGAIVGGILAAPMLAGGSGGASGGSLFNLGDIGGYFKPSTAFGESASSGFQGMGGTPSFDISQGAGWKPGGAELDLGSSVYTPTTEFGGVEAAEKGVDWAAMARMLQSVKPDNKPMVSSGGRVGGGFRFDRKPYENQLLTREYESLYNQPLYNKLG